MQRVLGFIASRDTEMTSSQRTAWSLSHDQEMYRDITSLVKYMAEKSAAVAAGTLALFQAQQGVGRRSGTPLSSSRSSLATPCSSVL